MIIHQYDSGIRSFDTAPHYGKGVSEKRLGMAYKKLGAEKMKNVETCTKAGRRLLPVAKLAEELQKDTVIEEEPAVAHSIFVNRDDTVCQVRDYSSSGVQLSHAESVLRLQLDTFFAHISSNMVLKKNLANKIFG